MWSDLQRRTAVDKWVKLPASCLGMREQLGKDLYTFSQYISMAIGQKKKLHEVMSSAKQGKVIACADEGSPEEPMFKFFCLTQLQLGFNNGVHVESLHTPGFNLCFIHWLHNSLDRHSELLGLKLW